MKFFEGKIFSTINDEMLSKLWGEDEFISDWEKQIQENNDLWRDNEIKAAKETIIKGFYSTYKELFRLLEEEDLTEKDKIFIKKQINLAMTNVLEYGQRRSKDISLSLRERKFPGEQNGSNVFNGIIDNLIFEIEKADQEFHNAMNE